MEPTVSAVEYPAVSSEPPSLYLVDPTFLWAPLDGEDCRCEVAVSGFGLEQIDGLTYFYRCWRTREEMEYGWEFGRALYVLSKISNESGARETALCSLRAGCRRFLSGRHQSGGDRGQSISTRSPPTIGRGCDLNISAGCTGTLGVTPPGAHSSRGRPRSCPDGLFGECPKADSGVSPSSSQLRGAGHRDYRRRSTQWGEANDHGRAFRRRTSRSCGGCDLFRRRRP